MNFSAELQKIDEAAIKFIREVVKKKKKIVLWKRSKKEDDEENENAMYELPTVTMYDNDGKPREECRIVKLTCVKESVFIDTIGTETDTDEYMFTLDQVLKAERIYLADVLKNYI